MSEPVFYLIQGKYIYLSYYAADDRVRMSIGETVTKKQWDEDKLPKEISQRLNRIKFKIGEYVGNANLANKPILKRDIEMLVGAELKVKRLPPSDRISDALSRFIQQITDGDILNKGKIYNKSTITIFHALQVHIQRTGISNISLNSFTVTHFSKLKKELLEAKLSQNTINAYITHLKAFLKRSNKMGWHSNTVYLETDIYVPSEDIDTAVYLNSEELTAISKTELSQWKYESVRDAFIFGCNTGLRHSDLASLKPDSYHNGSIHISTKKTKSKVVIPLNATAREIWERYDGRLKVLSNFHFNAHIRDVCKEAKIDTPTIYTNTQGGVVVSKHYPKYELVGSHTMRRSFATNAFLAGVKPISIMKITGHKTETSFMKYIRINNQENAEDMKGHSFFQ